MRSFFDEDLDSIGTIDIFVFLQNTMIQLNQFIVVNMRYFINSFVQNVHKLILE